MKYGVAIATTNQSDTVCCQETSLEVCPQPSTGTLVILILDLFVLGRGAVRQEQQVRRETRASSVEQRIPAKAIY
ncbi:hypothetical protein E2C01_016019 [Portunus trituberculatus]|uniref:Uncharacterized protein n=1 Tax=Portunus trituberculatus TaxID=210409 RepID=A0A5B7DNG3_PORTR|nr:hypothetical protein [Portunus trituberculatus]